MSEETFVAREAELGRLNQLLEQAIRGQGQVCLISGEAGAGKTALLSAFSSLALTRHSNIAVVLGSCTAHTGISDPYLPFREILAMLTGDVEGELGGRIASEENNNRLKGFLQLSGQAIVELGPDLVDIFVPGSGIITRAGTFLAEKAGWLKGLEQIEKRKKATPQHPKIEPARIVEQYSEVIKRVAERTSLILALDDLQWIDSASLDLFFHLSRHIAQTPLLIVATFRPEDVSIERDGAPHPLVSVLGDLKRYFGDIVLELDQTMEERRAFVWALIDAEPNQLDERFRDELLNHTSGHALFTVELLREMKDRGDLQKDEIGRWVRRNRIEWDALPHKVEGVIEARISRLGPADRETLQIASVEGVTFTGEMVASVLSEDPGAVIRRLSRELAASHQLVKAEGVEFIGSSRVSRYRFRHGLFQSYLYNELDETELAYLHEDVGIALEGIYGERVGEIDVQLAHHFTEAGNFEKAVTYLLSSGRRAHLTSAYNEAMEAFTRGLDLAARLPDEKAGSLSQLMLHLSLGNTLMSTRGPVDESVIAHFDAAVELSRHLEDATQSFIALRGLALHNKMQGKYEISSALEGRMLAMAKTLEDPILLTEAHRLVAESFVSHGDFEAGVEHYQQAMRSYHPELHPQLIAMLGSDSGLICQAQTAYFTWSLGYPQQAISTGEDVITLAHQLDHPFSLAIVLDTVAALYHQLREPHICLEIARECNDLSIEYGFGMWGARARVRQGWSLAVQGQVEEGIALIQDGLAFFQSLGMGISMPCLWALLGEAQLLAKDYDVCLETMGKALSTIEHLDERYCEVEVNRIRGECLRALGDGLKAEETYRKAIQVAQSQKAKLLELRARLHLARMQSVSGASQVEVQELAQLYEWFTEGFDTPDLKEARAFLDQRQLGTQG
jgi:tetratricopeptide (TPR) repeat protein